MRACMYVCIYVCISWDATSGGTIFWLGDHPTRAQTQTKDREKLEQFTEPQPIFSISKSLKEWFYRLLFIRSEL